MPAMLAEAAAPLGVSAFQRKRWTRHQCRQLEAAGLLDYHNYELLDGELVKLMPSHPKHNDGQMSLVWWLGDHVGRDYIRVEASVDLSPEDSPSNEPQPDIVVLRQPRQSLSGAIPTPAQIALLVEVSDSTLAFDLADKAWLYARAGIPEYWTLDVRGRRLIVHRSPAAGRYRSVQAYLPGERVAPLANPTAELEVATLF